MPICEQIMTVSAGLRQDPIVDKTAKDIRGLIHSSTLRYIDRSGHFPWIGQPDKMRNIVAEFLNSE
jgi:pimeloyl-ACP methyl ester carboxylesterase